MISVYKCSIYRYFKSQPLRKSWLLPTGSDDGLDKSFSQHMRLSDVTAFYLDALPVSTMIDSSKFNLTIDNHNTNQFENNMMDNLHLYFGIT